MMRNGRETGGMWVGKARGKCLAGQTSLYCSVELLKDLGLFIYGHY